MILILGDVLSPSINFISLHLGGQLSVVETLLANDSIDPNVLVADTNKHRKAGMHSLDLAANIEYLFSTLKWS